LGFGVWGLGFQVWGLGFGVWGLGFGVSDFEFRVLGFGFRVSGSRFRIGLQVSDSGFRVQGKPATPASSNWDATGASSPARCVIVNLRNGNNLKFFSACHHHVQGSARVRSTLPELLRRIVKRFRGGLVCKNQRLLYHSTLGSRVKKKKETLPERLARSHSARFRSVASRVSYLFGAQKYLAYEALPSPRTLQ